MRPKPNESYEEWLNRVRIYELGDALKKLAAGENIDIVLEVMAHKITEKALFPLYKKTKD